ncbi:hypothetical protein ACP70R_049713 [Stipagrostis hirtigluma subsp. patula]
MAAERTGSPLPKFGEWDVNDPASGEGFTVIFNKARDEKKTGGNLEGQDLPVTGQQQPSSQGSYAAKADSSSVVDISGMDSASIRNGSAAFNLALLNPEGHKIPTGLWN